MKKAQNLFQFLYDVAKSPQAWFGKFSHVMLKLGLKQSEADFSVFSCHTFRKCFYLTFVLKILSLEKMTLVEFPNYRTLVLLLLNQNFGCLKYFIGIVVGAQPRKAL